MSSKNVVRSDVVQISYDVDSSGLDRVAREINGMRSDIVSGVRSSDNALDDLQREARETAQELRDTSNSTEHLQENLEDTADSANGLSGMFGKMKGALGGLSGMLGGLAIATTIGAIAGSANDSIKAMNQLQAQTGATAAEMQMLKGIAQDVYTDGMGESLEDVARSMAEVRNQTGLTGESLKGLTNNALLMRDTFGFEVNESVRSADMLMRQFGIDGNEAYNIIAQGAQLGLDKNGNLLDSLNEYSVHFKQIGLDSKDMMSIFANSAEQGVFDIDKIGDAVKEFGIRAIDGSKTTAEGFAAIGMNADEMAAKFTAGGDTAKQAFNETIAALAGMEDPVARNAAGVALFGTMWEDLGAKAVLAFDTTNPKIKEGTEALDAINKVKYEDATTALSVLGRTVNVMLADSVGDAVNVATVAIRGLAEGVKSVGSFVREHWGAIKPIMLGVVAVFGTYMTILTAYRIGTQLAATVELLKAGALQASTAAMWASNAAMLANPWTWIVLGIMAIIAAIVLCVVYWDEIKAAVGSFFTAAWEYIQLFWQIIVSAFTMVKDFIVAIFTAILQFYISIWSAIWSVIDEAVMAIWSVISTTFSLIFQIISVIMQGIWSIIASIWRTIVSAVSAYLTWYFGIIRSIFSAVYNFIASIMRSVFSTISSIWNNVATAVSGVLGRIWSAVTEKFNSLVSWLSNLKSKFLEVGKNLIGGLLEGITSKMKSLTSKIEEIGGGVLSKIRGIFGVHSPSREFAIIGRYNMEGLEQGMEAGMPSLQHTVSAIGSNTMSSYGDYTPETSATAGNGSVSETNNFSPQFNLTISGSSADRDMERQVKQWITEAMNEMFDSMERKSPRLQEV